MIGYLGCSYSYGSDGSQMKDLPNFYDCYFSGQVVSASVESHKNIYGTTFILDSLTGSQPYELAFHNVYYDNQIA
ncbi:MAG: hypothetical protein K2M65_04550, partial [Muribaculaceae bacterium]|nr:hypothetical protein [Muribaculaceae bacterium]